MRITFFCAALIAAAAIHPAQSQTLSWPEKPIRLIVPAGPGGPNDVLARIVSQYLPSAIGQSIVVENRTGAGGGTAAKAVAAAEPDGYTLLIGNTALLAVIPAVSRNPGYDPIASFTPIVKLMDSMQVLIVSNDLSVKSVAEFVAYAKANPGKLNFASAGQGNLTHLAGELLKVKAGIDLVHVPYKAEAESLTALLGGQVQMTFANSGVVGPYIRDGKVSALAVTGDVRNKDFPELPTLAEAGVPGYAVTSFFGIVGPAKMPPAIVNKLNAALNQQMAAGPLRDALIKFGADPKPSTPQEFAAFIGSEARKWREIADAADIRID
jgi:tripartite-type tricarboxylate transporter receptor subunit TctC